MENLKIIYIDDYPETSLSKYLDKYKNLSCNVESLDIKFNPDAGYESLINNPDVKSANIIFIDSKLFENRTAIALDVTDRTIARYISELKDKGIIERKGPDNGGKWKIK